MTDNLPWFKHVSDTAGKAHCSLGFLRRNLKHCSRQVKAATYTSVVRPVLENASPVWDPYRQADIRALEQVQRRAALVHQDASQTLPTSLDRKAFRTDARFQESACCTKVIIKTRQPT